MEIGEGFCNPFQFIQQCPPPLKHRNHIHVLDDQISTWEDPVVLAQVEKEKQDIDLYIALQNERLRVHLQEQRMQQTASFIKTLETRALFLEMQKEEEIARESRKTAQLEDLLKRIEMQRQTYKRIAREKEAIAVALNNTLEQMREGMACSSSCAEDAESCCDFSLQEEDNEGREKMACKVCNSRESCFVILPCSHLCSCEVCEALLCSCPVCGSTKKASIQVYL